MGALSKLGGDKGAGCVVFKVVASDRRGVVKVLKTNGDTELFSKMAGWLGFGVLNEAVLFVFLVIDSPVFIEWRLTSSMTGLK